MADSIIRLHHQKGTPALARICTLSHAFLVCVCVCVCFFFVFCFGSLSKRYRVKAEPRTGFNFDLGSTVPRLSIGAALTLTWRTTKEHQKNGQLRKQPRPHIGKREDPGDEVGCASYNTNRPRCNWQGIGQAIKRNANVMRTPERGAFHSVAQH